MATERDFTDADAAVAWNAGAAAWDAFVESGADYYRHAVHGPALLAAALPVAGLRVLDLGSGQGYFTRQLARQGARVTGIEVAEELVALARGQEEREPLGIEYRVSSAARVRDEWEPERFDLVTSCMALQDMADVPAVLRGAFEVLRPGGRLVLSVPHPVTDAPYREWEHDADGRKLGLRLDRYFDTGPAVMDWNMPRLAYRWATPFRRLTRSEWIRMVREAGFAILSLDEPRPTAAQVEADPRLEDGARMPFFLVMALGKPRSSS